MPEIPSQKSVPERLFGPTAIFAFFAGAGVLHLARPKIWIPMVPPQLPAPDKLVLVSGVAEIAGGALYLSRRTRGFAVWYLIALLWAVFPSNIHMAVEPKFHGKVPGGQRALIARLPLQFVLMWWLRRLAQRTAA